MSSGVHQLQPPAVASREARLDALLLRDELEERNAAYCAALDRQDLTGWVTYFTSDAFYVVISRENHDAGLPVGLIYCEGQKMIHDRAFALLKTSMFGPRYLRHLVGRFAVEPAGEDGAIHARANYVVFEVLTDRPDARLHQIGEYRDIWRREDGVLRLSERRCIYDNLLVPTALCIPV